MQRNSKRVGILGGCLITMARMLSCSSSEQQHKNTDTAHATLTATQIRVLNMNDGIDGSSGDWIASSGSISTVTSPKVEGTQAMTTTLALVNGATKVTATSIK